MQAQNELPIFLAAVYLRDALSAIEPKCSNVDFHSFLKENCRDHLPLSALTSGIGRGNRNIYGTIPKKKQGRKVVYEIEDLSKFVEHCKAKPNLIEFMTRSIH